MTTLLQILRDFLPLQIALLIVVFLYFLKIFLHIAGEFARIAERQVDYLRQRLDSIEKMILANLIEDDAPDVFLSWRVIVIVKDP